MIDLTGDDFAQNVEAAHLGRVPVTGPIPRQENRQLVLRQAGNAGENIGEPG